MSTFANVDEILDFAIDGEQAAVDLYTDLAAKAKNPTIKKAFEEYANEERGHKTKLQEVKTGKRLLIPSEKPVLDLKIADYTVEEEPGPDADYQSVLIFAKKKRKLRSSSIRIWRVWWKTLVLGTCYWAWPKKRPNTNCVLN